MRKKTKTAQGVVLACAALFALMLFLNLHTPLQMDDYDYSFSWSTGLPVSGIWDILRSQAVHYRIWGGRAVTHTLTQLFLWLGKGIFNPLNALCYVLLLLAAACLGRQRTAGAVLAGHLLLQTLPFFGTVFLWLDGACNYLWGTLIALLPLLLLDLRRSGKKIPLALALPLCFLAGWTNENTACGILVALAMHRILFDRNEDTRVPLSWIFAQAAGAAVLVLAPGNFARAQGYGLPGITVLLKRALRVGFYYVRYLWAPLLLVLLGEGKHCRETGHVRGPGEHFLLLASMLCAVALIGSPEISDRTFTGAFFLAMADGLLHFNVSRPKILIPAMGILVLILGFMAGSAVLAHEEKWHVQTDRIKAAAALGEETAAIDSVPSVSRYTMDITIEKDPQVWPNSTLSKWYGVEIIGSDAQGNDSDP